MRCGALLLCLLPLAACGHPAAAPAAATSGPATRTADPGSPDGAWRGSSTRFQADGRGCPGPGLVYAQVLDRQFQLRWGNRANIAATIGPDGSITGQSGEVTLSGHFTGTAITADAVSPSCGLHYTLRRAA